MRSVLNPGLWRFVFLGAVAASAFCALPRTWAAADGSGEPAPRLAGVAGVERPDTVKDTLSSNENKESEDYERRVRQGERNRLIPVIVLLGIVFAVFVVWWGWGKLFRRERKL